MAELLTTPSIGGLALTDRAVGKVTSRLVQSFSEARRAAWKLLFKDIGRAVRWVLGNRPAALATCLALAALVLLPGLGDSGLWDPQERQLSDRIAPSLDAGGQPSTKARQLATANNDCLRAAPEDALARSLTPRAIVWGRDTFGDDDAGRRLPLALFGLITVIAAAGTAMRIGGARAAVVTSAVLLAMPLLALQSRMLTSEIGTPCGGALIVYGCVALSRLRRGRWLALDASLASIALIAGLGIAFLGGGALLGLLVPIGGFAVAGSLDLPFVVPRRDERDSVLPAILAMLAAAGLIAVLAYQLYELKEPYPGMTPPPARALFGTAIVSDGCWSSALGAVWRPEDDPRFIFDSTFEQIAYGTFPWGILAPIAMCALLRSDDPGKRTIGAVTLAWAGGAWIASEAFQRKVGFTIFAGFPALAIAVGVWLDDLLQRRARPAVDAAASSPILIGLFVALGVLDLGKDLQSFTEKLTSLLVGTEQIPYPKDAVLLFGVSPRSWLLLIGAAIGIAFASSMAAWRAGGDETSRTRRRIADVAIAISLAATIALAGFWSFAWQPRLSLHLSSKAMLETYDELRGDARAPLVVMGDLGDAPRFYADVIPEVAQSRDQIVAALKRPQRVFAIAPQAELCPLHREMGDRAYFVIDDRNARSLLLSNRIDGATDKNPLAEMIQHKEPNASFTRPKGRVVWDNKIELVGWDLPARVDRGDSFEVVTYFKILAPPGGAWTMLMHFDGPLRLRDGDHKPINDRCPTSSWMAGDYIIDRHTMRTSGGNFPAGRYDLWIGFFTGTTPNFRNMTVSAAPGDMRDTVDRVKIAAIVLD